jgi:hypothetical protein
MSYRTLQQNTRLHALIGELYIDAEMKEDLVLQFSNQRTNTSSKLLVVECEALINHLQSVKNGYVIDGNKGRSTFDKNTPENKMRRKILSICHEIHWTKNGSIDWNKLDAFLLKSGYLHKEKLNDYTVEELPKLVTQFEQLQKTFYAKR